MNAVHPKVKAGGAAGALGTVLVFTCQQLHLAIPGDVAFAAATLICGGAAWAKRA